LFLWPTWDEDLPFKVVRANSHDEVLPRASNLLIGRATYETAARMYPTHMIVNCRAARVIYL
jgi:hypothetical protein